ncbi:MAG: type II toxin-antitoxin system RelE/ParE family toxin [Clostridiales bacterium]|nr:type II toxin-antitoxin system RelE/ParE family toxin [Clostridiales bacterium]
MKRILFSPQALIDIEEIREYISIQFGEKSAAKNIALVMHDIKLLEQFPLQGPGIWERYGIESDYHYIYSNKNYVFYRIEDDTVKIIRILDARRDFLNILFGI